jgi:hypothetical protein
MRAIFFAIGEHEIMPCQEPIAFAEFCRRRILGRQLAFSRPSTITLRRRYVISHSLARGHEQPATLLDGSAMGQGACG